MLGFDSCLERKFGGRINAMFIDFNRYGSSRKKRYSHRKMLQTIENSKRDGKKPEKKLWRVDVKATYNIYLVSNILSDSLGFVVFIFNGLMQSVVNIIIAFFMHTQPEIPLPLLDNTFQLPAKPSEFS